jgi:DnaK suppressor protein
MDTYEGRMAGRFRGELLERAEQLRRILDHEAQAANGDDVHEVGDFKDAAAEESIANVDQAQAAHAAQELGQVQAALRRVADGTYGECLDCGDPIDLRRLAALPATPYCAACQSVHERERERH